MQKPIKINASELSTDDLRIMVTDQTKLSALADMAEKARLSKSELKGKSFHESFFLQVSQILRN